MRTARINIRSVYRGPAPDDTEAIAQTFMEFAALEEELQAEGITNVDSKTGTLADHSMANNQSLVAEIVSTVSTRVVQAPVMQTQLRTPVRPIGENRDTLPGAILVFAKAEDTTVDEAIRAPLVSTPDP